MEAARHIGIHEERSLRHMLDQDLLAIARTLDRTDLADQDHDPVGLRSGNGQLRVLTARDRVLVLKTECLGHEQPLRERVAPHLAAERCLQELPANNVPGSLARQDRKSVVKGKRVSVRVDLGGRRILKKKKKK